MKIQIVLLFIIAQLNSVLSQENGISLSYQQFDFSNPKSNITNNWSWFNINYYRKTKSCYSWNAGFNLSSSYLFTKSTVLFNPIPRGRTSFENIGLSYTNKLSLKEYDDKLYWGLSNQINLNPTRIFSTYLDSTGAGKNLYTDKFLLFRFDLGINLQARIMKNIYFGFTPSVEYYRFNSSVFGKADGFRGKFEFALILFPKLNFKK